MKILKIFGAVVGVHFLAFILIFANPGCSSTAKQGSAPPPASATGPSPSITVPASTYANDSGPNISVAPMTSSDSSVAAESTMPALSTPRYNPTRPNTAAASAVQAQPVADVTPATTYTVVNGDSLSAIAKKNHTTTKELTAANHLKTDSKLKLGQKLIIPGKTAAAAATSATKPTETAPSAPVADTKAKSAAPGGSLTHTVKSGESLGSIARKYQVKQGEIAVANNITNPAMIKAGMVLTIPGWQPPAKTGKAATTASTPAAQAAPSQLPPPPGQDLDAGLKPSSSTEIPVIKIDDSQSTPAPKSP